MESIDKLLADLIAAGASAKEAGEACDKMREFMAGIEEVLEAFESLRRSILDAFAASLGYLEELATAPLQPKEKLPRPPRSAGPQNKGRAWNRQPPRLARSCCRKMRR